MAIDIRGILNANLPALDPQDFSDEPPEDFDPPFGPDSIKRPKPSDEEVGELAVELQAMWQPRNDRLEFLDRLWRLTTPAPKSDWEQVMALPDPRLDVNKLAARLGRAQMSISVKALTPVEVTEAAAQREEDFCQWFMYTADRMHREGIAGALQYEIAFSGLHRGARCDMVLPNPFDRQFPWTIHHIDWANVYPSPGRDPGRPIICVVPTHAREVKQLFPKAEVGDPKANVNQALIYWCDDTWMGIYLGGIESSAAQQVVRLKGPVRHGYSLNPLVVTPFNGTPLGPSPWDTSDWVKYVGVPVLDPVAQWTIEFNRVLSRAFTHQAKEYSPPVMIYQDPTSGNVKTMEIDLSPNAMNVVPKGVPRGGVEIWNPGSMLAETAQIMNIMESRQEKFMPSVLYGKVGANQSGYGIDATSEDASDAFYPGEDGVNSHVSRLLTRAKDHLANDNIGLRGVFIASQGRAEPYSWEDAKLDTELTATLADVSPRDKDRAVALATQAVSAGLMSVMTAVEWAKISDNPKLEVKRVLSEMMSKDPELLKVKVAGALRDLGRMDDLQAFMALITPPTPGGQQQPPPQMPGAGPGQPPPQMPGAPPEMPPQPGGDVVPPEQMGASEAVQVPLVPGEQGLIPGVTNG